MNYGVGRVKRNGLAGAKLQYQTEVQKQYNAKIYSLCAIPKSGAKICAKNTRYREIIIFCFGFVFHAICWCKQIKMPAKKKSVKK